MKTQREKFEDWANKYHGSMNMGKVGDVYSNHNVMHDWFLWQAAIESVVVELPPVFDAAAHDATYYEYAYSQLGIHSALDEAGIKYE